MNTLQDRIRDPLIGGAIGDALGYLWSSSIPSREYKFVMENVVSLGRFPKNRDWTTKINM
jgi:ADP-ribosylglycohydrolase